MAPAGGSLTAGGGRPAAGSGGQFGGLGGLNAPGGAAGEPSGGGAGPSGPPLELGPYKFNGGIHGYSRNVDEYTLSLADGNAWFVVKKDGENLALNQPVGLGTGLLWLPSTGPLPGAWICPGPGATWAATKSSKPSACDDSQCDFELVMPNPSRLPCKPGSDQIALGPVESFGSATTPLTSSFADLNGLMMDINAAQLELNPALRTNASSLEAYSVTTGIIRLEASFTSTPSAIPADEATPITSWLLGLSFIRRLDGSFEEQTLGQHQLYCGNGGGYQLGLGPPVTHSIQLENLSAPVQCPGEPLAQSLVLRIAGTLD